jgi:DNA polymerase V
MAKTDKATGFPSPAQGYEAKSLDFNQILVGNPPATYIMEAATSNMAAWGIFPGSLLVVDRSRKPGPGSVVVAAYDGAFFCREMVVKGGEVSFTDGASTITPRGGEVSLFGTVRAVVRLL